MRLGFFSVMIATVALTSTVKAVNLNMEWAIAPPETEEVMPSQGYGYAQVAASSNEISDL